MRLIAAFPLALLGAASALAQAANNCADPYWKHALRCQLSPSQPPQPETPPTAPPSNNIPKFTRVWLEANPQVRCVDGTKPLLYVDKAICTSAAGCGTARYGEPAASNRWIFTVPGGGSCHGEYCAEFYADPAERGEMSSATKPEMKNMDGIHDPDPQRNPVFAGYNRVRIEKCSYDRYLGKVSAEAEGGAFHSTRNGMRIDYNLYYHGALMWEEAFRLLEKGLEYSTWETQGGQPVSVRETLPPLANAEVVLIVGHSGGNHGLFHNIDNLSAALGRIQGFRGDVRALFDANFLPSVENEAAFAATAPARSDAYNGITRGTSSSAPSGAFSYDAKTYYETGVLRQQYEAWDAELDVSCLAAHGNDSWKCRDRHHVLFNHITTPFFAREDQKDPNPEHNDLPRGHPVQWADAANYPNCGSSSPCTPRLNTDEYRARVQQQARTLIDFSGSRSELALAVDRSGAFPSFYLWLPACQKHDGAYSDESFFVPRMGGYTMRGWLEAFLRAPRNGARAWLIDGMENAAGAMVEVQCQGGPPPRRRSVAH